MVKKVGGNKPIRPNSIQSTKTTQSQGVNTVGDVGATKGSTRSSRAKGATRMITGREKEELMRMVREEADKLFGDNGLPESKRETVEDAVRMTIDASVEVEDE